MVRTHLTRKVSKSTIKGYTLSVKDGTPEVNTLEPVTVWGAVSRKEAERILRKIDPTAVLGSVETVEETYRISLNDFVKYAEKVEGCAVEAETEDEQ